jgi:hypothetical protein
MESNQLTPPLLDGGQGKISNIDKNKIYKNTNDKSMKGVAEKDSGLEDHEQHANQSKQTEAIPPSTKELNIQMSNMSDNEQGIISPLGDSKQEILSPMEETTKNDTSRHNVHAQAKN